MATFCISLTDRKLTWPKESQHTQKENPISWYQQEWKCPRVPIFMMVSLHTVWSACSLEALMTDIKHMEVWHWSKETWSVINHNSTGSCFSLPSCLDIRLCECKSPRGSVVLSENLLRPENFSKDRLTALIISPNYSSNSGDNQ